ncbi:MAG: glycosyltransferase [Candidatus Korobacteraceae bacterium]
MLKSNFLASPCLGGAHGHQILVQRDYSSAANAYNDAIDRAENDLMVFAHQDMVFPESWLAELDKALAYLEKADPSWGVLGCYGVTHDGVAHGHIYQQGLGLIGRSFDCPQPIQTLDEIVLIFRRSSRLRFDDQLLHYHLYGTDICMRAAKKGMNSYAVSAFCLHNSNYYQVLPKEFYECYRHIRRVWWDVLPIHTSCVTITRMNLPMFQRRLRDAYLQYIRKRAFLAPRVKDVTELIRQYLASAPGP